MCASCEMKGEPTRKCPVPQAAPAFAESVREGADLRASLTPASGQHSVDSFRY
ncbi:hypothetical protein DESPIG_03124 [Desulfovibrio piger ATCC 29098]|uniref:Uncharacterized protein n=1 Tax=Desulfovibrio piger ATCC 29098 TaxID=411464 RepID=B6WYE2_9BACT|nr:hypothetical protein DESPIG_03124 [Desulfovibrio piger ATCC 29098]